MCKPHLYVWLIIATIWGASGCNSLKAGLAEPELKPIINPSEMVGHTPISMPQPRPDLVQYAPNSLWRVGARGFFDDQRASKVGDILTVSIAITDNANINNTTTTARTANTQASITALFGLEQALDQVLPAGATTSPLTSANSTNNNNGTGTINRAETINLTVAAVITDILPNGNFVIAGRQEVKVNIEVRELLVSGVIRPEDISANNTIAHTQIAEARISYAGRGDLTKIQRARPAQRAYGLIFPF